MNVIKEKRLVILIISLIVILPIIFNTCSRKPSPEDVVIRINSYALTLGEFDELLCDVEGQEDTPEARETCMEALITRKLLLQEAQKEGLDRQEDFLKSVEKFWEQALLKIVVDEKSKEISKNIIVTDEEIMDEYNKWVLAHPEDKRSFEELYEVLKWQTLKAKQTQAFDSWIDALRENARIKVNKKAIGIK